MWWGILDLSGLADEEGIVSDQHSDKCKQTAMTDLETTSMTDLECVICDDADGAERQCSQLLPAITQLQKNVNLIKFAYLAETPTSTKVQILEFRGAYEEVFNTLELVRYKPEPYQNHWRLKSRFLSKHTAQKAPYEKMVISLMVDDPEAPGTALLVSELTQMLHISDVNNAPVLANPGDNYRPSPVCAADPLSTMGQCHFGQFFRLEDTSKTLSIAGVKATDIDLWETCSYTFPECTKVDVNVVTLKGSTGLNTRVNLNVYQNQRSALGFGSYLADVSSAIQVLFYQVELQELVGTEASTVNNYNTQNAEKQEYITVIVSDQGSQGAEGVSKIASTEIPITIVAVNDDPIIHSKFLEYGVQEDSWSELKGNYLSDVDLDEQIVSSLADLEWLKASESANVINLISLTISVKRGMLYLSYSRNLKLNFTQIDYLMTIVPYKPKYPEADFCFLNEKEKLGFNEYDAGGGSKYGSVCSHINAGSEQCASGVEEGCICDTFPSCADTLLVLNRSKAGWDSFRAKTIAHVASSERTCGGLPRFKPPMNVSFGKGCSDCESGKPCSTCANKNLFKCRLFDMKVLTGEVVWNPASDKALYDADEQGVYPEHCSNGKKDATESAVDKGGDCWPAMPALACRCCANISHACSSDRDCAPFWEGNIESPCGCSPGAPILQGLGSPFAPPAQCGPYRDPVSGAPVSTIKAGVHVVGTACTYTGPGSDICRSALFVKDGTSIISRLEDLGVGMDGSKTISVFGPLPDINRCLDGLVYKGDLHYNRLYRLPPEQRDPATFKMESDDLDKLEIIAGDNGNSGGMERDERQAIHIINIRVAAVNDRPEIDAPLFVSAVEDQRYLFDTSKMPVGLGGSGGPMIECPETNERFAIYGRLTYKCLPVQILDPDQLDFGFADKKFLLTIYAEHGVLFLDEEFLKTAEVRKANHPDDPDKCARCAEVVAQDNCCKCNSALGGCSISFHESGRQWWLDQNTRPQGLHSFGGPEFDVGNQLLAVEGTYSDINTALLGFSYLSHPNFNTRYGVTESITIEINDQGNMGEDYFSTKHLTAKHVINVLVDSVNDPPQVGRLLPVTDIQLGVYDTDPRQAVDSKVLFPFDDRRNVKDECFTMAVTDISYRALCAPQPLDLVDRPSITTASYRSYIDIDEDTVFIVTPDVLWIDDVDSQEAILIGEMEDPPSRRYKCAGENVNQKNEDRGCFCGAPCVCGATACDCAAPSICFDDMTPTPGDLIVELSVESGMLSLYPPAGRSLIPGIEFLTNTTALSIEECVQTKESRKAMKGDLFTLTMCAEACPDQIACMQNQSRISIRTLKSSIQEALEKAYIIYSGRPDGVGTGGGLDTLRIWVSDQGMTDETYASNDALVAGTAGTVGIRVVAVNDAPTITYPSSLLIYAQGDRCFVDVNDQLRAGGINCYRGEALRVPPVETEPAQSSIFISDWDLDDVEWGNLTLILRIGKPNAGRFQFLKKDALKLMVDVSFLVFKNDVDQLNLALAGPRGSINSGLPGIHYDTDASFIGYLPITVTADDNGNYGECSGDHECGQAKPCLNHRTATPHVADRRGRNSIIIDVMVGGKTYCMPDCQGLSGAQCCDKCQRLPEYCGWCSGECGGQGKCMSAAAGRTKPLFATCLPNQRDGRTFGQCDVRGGDLIGSIMIALVAVIVLALVTWRLMLWIRRRHGSALLYLKKKQVDLQISATRLNLSPPPEARYLEFFMLCIFLLVFVLYQADLFTVKDKSCVFTHGFYLDTANAISLELDTCNVRFLPAHMAQGVDKQIRSAKVLFSFPQNDPDMTLSSDTCSGPPLATCCCHLLVPSCPRNCSCVLGSRLTSCSGEGMKGKRIDVVNGHAGTASLSLQNTRSDIRRYDGYYCSVLVMVPDRVVLPGLANSLHAHLPLTLASSARERMRGTVGGGDGDGL